MMDSSSVVSFGDLRAGLSPDNPVQTMPFPAGSPAWMKKMKEKR
jgi:hypothetical protein